MAFDKQFRTPAVLTGIARGTFDGVYGSSVVTDYLPPLERQALTFEFTPNARALTQAANFRAYNTEADQAVFAPDLVLRGELAPISRRANVDEYTQLKMLANGSDAAVADAFERHTALIASQIAMRFVKAAAEAIETGKLNINERGLALEVDYGRAPALTRTASTPWSDPAADIIGDLIAARAAYGAHPGRIIISRQISYHLSKNEGIIEQAYGPAAGLDRIAPAAAIDVLAQFGFEGIIVNEERYIDQSGAEKYLFSQEKVIFLPPAVKNLHPFESIGALGNLQLGVTSEALAEVGLNRSPGLAAGAIKTEDPNGFDILVAGIGLPVITSANRTAALTVL